MTKLSHHDYHISFFGPCQPHWPKGGWSIYHITGDDIAKRVEFGEDNKAVRRDSWCGYMGIFETLPEAMAAIKANEEDPYCYFKR
jgi:hypothetical protein